MPWAARDVLRAAATAATAGGGGGTSAADILNDSRAWARPELTGAQAAAARLVGNRPLPRPTWSSGSWDAWPAAVPFGLRAGMVFQARKDGVRPTGFGGAMRRGQLLTLKGVFCDPDDGCVLHWEERGGCTILDEPRGVDFRANVRRFMGDLAYVPDVREATREWAAGDRVRILKGGRAAGKARPVAGDRSCGGGGGGVLRQPRGNVATVRYVGSVFFSPGAWLGLELDEVGQAGGGVSGRNDGSVSRDGRSVRYFQAARPQSGLFVRPDAVQRLDMDSQVQAAAVEGESNASAGRESNGSDEDLDSAGADGVADGCGPSVFGRTMRLNLAAQEGEAAAVKQILDERLVEQCTLSSLSPPSERAPAGEQTPAAARAAFALRGAASAESEVERMLARARARARLGSEAQRPAAAARAPASQLLPRPAVPADTADAASTEQLAGDGDDDHTDASGGGGGGGGGTAQQGPDLGAAQVVEASADVCSPPSSTSPSSSASSSSSSLAHQQQVLTRRRQRAEARAEADAEREARPVVYRREA
eukprot:COSAG01_NODE_11383_length_1947_cov_2.551948_1_plen_535_part_10